MNPTDKNESIEFILSQGLAGPRTARERMADMVRSLGLRFLFWDTGYSLFFAALTLAGVFVLFSLTPDAYRCTAAVAAAPLLFLAAILFAETSERLGGLYELKQTCRYTIRQITAMRVTCYSVVGSAFTAVIAAVSADNGYEFLSLFPLCLSALFVCAVLALYVQQVLHSNWVHAAFSAAWVIANVALPFALGEKWEAILREMPIALSFVFSVFGAAALAWQLSNMLREVQKHAIA
ncbi:hypothetical protein [Paenibacillus ginsengarvi]|uniref:Uncharacterized protein n=1 Tax=Paenibacillus ginsengarvi TaxID=400777 RepID=A0A3B0C5L5_9BACL|nr:hypothetical protein [Paenibacillus ginsengarvi]RKN80610.1 hypothetical protein D7M11_19195 [Paenibacillus ginsengarvi]